uniref:Platelet-derived growth factor (PDGF) family profile domain-containing protein n=1 Tax=Meleagris gallopavo TaxID=9103 RepID=A0A803YNJ5_MELGA
AVPLLPVGRQRGHLGGGAGRRGQSPAATGGCARSIWNRSFCRPREQLVDIITEFPNEVEYIFRPSCVSLQRCGGCCGDEGLRCVPVQTGTVTVQVSTAPWGRGWRWAPGRLCARGLPSRCRGPAQVPSRGVPTPVLCAPPGGRVRPLVAQTSFSASLPSPQSAVHKELLPPTFCVPVGLGFPCGLRFCQGDGREVPAVWQLPCARRRAQRCWQQTWDGMDTRGPGCFMVSRAARVLALHCR